MWKTIEERPSLLWNDNRKSWNRDISDDLECEGHLGDVEITPYRKSPEGRLPLPRGKCSNILKANI